MPSARRSRRRPWGEEHPPLDLERARGGLERVETAADGSWRVRTVSGSEKAYRCPGCLQEVPPAVQHAVAGAEDALFGPEAPLSEQCGLRPEQAVLRPRDDVLHRRRD